MVGRGLPAGLRQSRARVDERVEHYHLAQRLVLVNNLLLLLEALQQEFVGLASWLFIRANLRVRLQEPHILNVDTFTKVRDL